MNALADLEARGVAFVSLKDNVDLSTPSGEECPIALARSKNRLGTHPRKTLILLRWHGQFQAFAKHMFFERARACVRRGRKT